jgi:hypothetical protein
LKLYKITLTESKNKIKDLLIGQPSIVVLLISVLALIITFLFNTIGSLEFLSIEVIISSIFLTFFATSFLVFYFSISKFKTKEFFSPVQSKELILYRIVSQFLILGVTTFLVFLGSFIGIALKSSFLFLVSLFLILILFGTVIQILTYFIKSKWYFLMIGNGFLIAILLFLQSSFFTNLVQIYSSFNNFNLSVLIFVTATLEFILLKIFVDIVDKFDDFLYTDSFWNPIHFSNYILIFIRSILRESNFIFGIFLSLVIIVWGILKAPEYLNYGVLSYFMNFAYLPFITHSLKESFGLVRFGKLKFLTLNYIVFGGFSIFIYLLIFLLNKNYTFNFDNLIVGLVCISVSNFLTVNSAKINSSVIISIIVALFWILVNYICNSQIPQIPYVGYYLAIIPCLLESYKYYFQKS